jgi:CBS domain-containing protein
MARRPPLRSPQVLRHRRQQRTQRLLATRAVRDALVSLAGVIGRPVRHQTGEEVGRLVDVVARWGGSEPYPPVTGLVVRVGRREAFVDADQILELNHAEVRLNSARLDLRDFVRRPGEVTLARDVLDHQLVDVDGVQVIRAADLYLAVVWNAIRLVGVDVSVQSLLRRLGPSRLRTRPTPDKVIDWAAIQPFGAPVPQVRLRSSHDGLRRLRPGELADLLEDLGRPARQELLAALEPETVADALEEMDPEELGALLRETPPDQAAELIANMEPDEAVDALRDLEEAERDELFEHMNAEQREQLEELLDYEEDRAGGFMTTSLIIAGLDDTVAEVREQLREARDHSADVDAVVVVDRDGRVVDDLALYELAVADPGQSVAELLGEAAPVTVGPDAEVRDVAQQLVESRRGSVVVVDADGMPLGRILADDVVDALLPDRGRFHFPRLLQ